MSALYQTIHDSISSQIGFSKLRPRQIGAYLNKRFGVEVNICDKVTRTYVDIACISGKKIIVNADVRDELEIIFIIAHLFGHMVQFTNYENYHVLVEETEKPKPLNLSDNFKRQFYLYEVEAYQIGKGLLEEVFKDEHGYVESIDARYQIYMDTDFQLFWRYLTKGEQTSAAEFNRMLRRNYNKWRENYKMPLASIHLPLQVNPQKDVVVC